MVVDIEIVNYLFKIKDEQVPVTVVDVNESENISFIILFYNVSFHKLTNNLEFLNLQVIC